MSLCLNIQESTSEEAFCHEKRPYEDEPNKQE